MNIEQVKSGKVVPVLRYMLSLAILLITNAVIAQQTIPGILTTPFGNGTDMAQATVLQPDGKTVTAGYYSNGVNNDVALARYNANGVLDVSFANGGKVNTSCSFGERVIGIALQINGKIIVVGE